MRQVQAAMLVAAISVAACSRYAQERQSLIDFFAAARLRDTTLLSNMGTATFEPRTDGIVQQFDITSVYALPARMKNGQAIEEKHVSISAQVRLPDGEIRPETMDVTFERPVGGRWTITQLRASRTSPATSSAPSNTGLQVRQVEE